MQGGVANVPTAPDEKKYLQEFFEPMPANHNCGCEKEANPHPDNTLQLLEALGAEIAKMPSEDLFDLPVGRVRQAFQNFYDVAVSISSSVGTLPPELPAKDKPDPLSCRSLVDDIIRLLNELEKRWNDMANNPLGLGKKGYDTHKHYYQQMQGWGYGEDRDGLTRLAAYLYAHRPPCPETEALRSRIEEWKTKPAPKYPGNPKLQARVNEIMLQYYLSGHSITETQAWALATMEEEIDGGSLRTNYPSSEAWDLAWTQIVEAYPPSRFSYYVCPGCHGGNTWVGPLNEKPNPQTPRWVYAVPGLAVGTGIIAVVGLGGGSIVFWLVESGLRLAAK